MDAFAQMPTSPPKRAAPSHLKDDKPLPSLPSLPSPTLTNPDMVLPDFGSFSLSSPERNNARPPSVSYLQNMRQEGMAHNGSPNGTPTGSPGAEGVQQGVRKKKSGLGLMSRKMMLLRSRTGSNMGAVPGQQTPPRSEASHEDETVMASSPTIQEENTNMSAEWGDPKRESLAASSVNSEERAELHAFLAKYKANEGADDDQTETDIDSPERQRMRRDVGLSEQEDAQRRAQADNELNSAMLSRRAEHILANAKKRLNLMEGNLRGARDLVTPLTAANLKRATSLGSSHGSPAPNYITRRYQAEGYSNSPTGQPLRHALHAQASSPTMGRDFRQGHARGFSEAELPERPSTAIERGYNLSGMAARRIPVRPADPSWTRGLRGTRSSEALGGHDTIREPLHARGSPDPNLTSVSEDDGAHDSSTTPTDGYLSPLGISRPPSATDNLREQMSSLKGKISTLKERAREDSLRRQSMNNMRAVSPLNNAEHEPPEVWYNGTSAVEEFGETDAKIGAGHDTNGAPVHYATLKTGSRNAFADMQNGPDGQPNYHTNAVNGDTAGLPRSSSEPMAVQSSHQRTASGTAIVGPAKNRYAHHQQSDNRSMPGSFDINDNDVQSEHSTDFGENESVPYDAQTRADGDNESIYEDASTEYEPVVAHEDRPDHLDYEHFFLRSAMSHYSQHQRSPSGSSISSASTARGPVATPSKANHLTGPDLFRFPPPTPETPEALREVERKIQHNRNMSADSVSTVASFATATEGPNSNRSSLADWPIRTASALAHPPSEPPRPSTTVRRTPATPSPSSPSSDGRPMSAPQQLRSPRSAIRLNHHHNFSHGHTAAGAPLLSPPMSPVIPFPVKDPTSVAVNALLDPSAKALGLKDKALLFGLVDDLRRVVSDLQRGGVGEAEARQRVEGLKRAMTRGCASDR